MEAFSCRPGCAACCIVVSISSALPGMPFGKPAGVRCVNLSGENRCRIYGRQDYPAVCANFKASSGTCGNDNEFAMENQEKLERLTSP